MCGIVGYIGKKQAGPVLLDGLSKLEYRGYDSAGIAVSDGTDIHVVKAKGRLSALAQLTKDGTSLEGTAGIGHTRWATHGEPSVANAHPHYNQSKTITVVHNGIIENYLALRERLTSKGYHFVSETDTEVVAHLLDYYYAGNPLETISKVLSRVEGSYALAILFHDFPDKIYAVRKDSPLIVGLGDTENFVASDVPAILKYTRNVVYLDNYDVVEMTREGIHFYNRDLEEIDKEVSVVEWDMEAAEKGGYEHFMLKEIFEQPKAVKDTISPRIKEGKIVIEELGMTEEELRAVSKIYIVACGSAYHAGVVAKYVLEGIARIPVEVDLASEFRYRNPVGVDNAMTIIISQSGETADSKEALHEAQRMGMRTLGVVNVVGSAIAREADNVMYTWAGPEIAVATTKAYSAQVASMYLLAMVFAQARETISNEEYDALLASIQEIPDKITEILGDVEYLQKYATQFANDGNMFFIGRGIDYAAAMEASLKLKEISYIHSEAYAAGELKHGTISLIEKDILVVALMTQPNLMDKIVSNMVEVKSRGAIVMAITDDTEGKAEQVSDYVIHVPACNPWFMASMVVVPMQVFSYYVALAKGYDPDKPRNLAKSVTVE